jgi:hypothetical protein
MLGIDPANHCTIRYQTFPCCNLKSDAAYVAIAARTQSVITSTTAL